MFTTSAYENQLIGLFLFVFGQKYGQRFPDPATAPPIAINLFQQTPLDSRYSDMIAGSDRCLILEFKRSINTLSTERAKWDAAALAALANDGPFQKRSRMAHLMIYGRPKQSGVELPVCFYTDALRLGEVDLDRHCAFLLISHLIDAQLGTKQRLGLPPAQLMDYLADLARRRRTQSEGRGSNTEGAWLGIAHGENGLRMIAAQSLEQLLDPARTYERREEPERDDRPRGPER